MSFRAKRRNLFLLLVAVLAASCTRPDILTLFVGTYSDGFYAYDFDQRAGEFVGEGPVAKAEMPNPSYLAVRDSRVYAVSEMPDTTASVWAWRWGGNGFELINSQPTGVIPSEAKESPFHGEDPCYVATDGTLLAVANYSGGTLATYRLREDGSIAPLDSLLVSGSSFREPAAPTCPVRRTPMCIAPSFRLKASICFSASSVPMRSAAWTCTRAASAAIAARLPCMPTTVPGICCSTLPASTCT